MSKTPSSGKRATAKKKIPSTKFPKAKRKISSGKFAKGKKAAIQPSPTDVPLDRPTDEQSRQVALAILKSRADTLRAERGKTK